MDVSIQPVLATLTNIDINAAIISQFKKVDF